MTATLTYTGKLTIVRCWCGIAHAIPADLNATSNDNPKFTVWCPLGHRWVRRTSEADRLRAQLDQARAEAREQRITATNNRRWAEEAAGRLKRTELRIANGVCPCCNRQFQNVARHMATKHPDLAATELVDHRSDPVEDRVLATLATWGPQPVTDLARRMSLQYQGCLAAVHHLQAQGLVHYRRRHNVTLIEGTTP